MTTAQRTVEKQDGPYEMLTDIRQFIDTLLTAEEKALLINTNAQPQQLGIWYLNLALSLRGFSFLGENSTPLRL